MQKGFAPILLLIPILILVAVGGGYYFGKSQAPKPVSQNQIVSEVPKVIDTPQASSTPDETANWKTYTNNKYNFSFNYPQNWTVTSEEQQQEVLRVVAKGPNSITISYFTGPPGVGGKCSDDPNIDLGHEGISIFNTPLNLFYHGDKSKDIISSAYVIEGDIPCPNIAFFHIPAVKRVDASWVETRLGQVGIYYGDEKNIIEKKSLDFKSSDLVIAKQILSTFKFTN